MKRRVLMALALVICLITSIPSVSYAATGAGSSIGLQPGVIGDAGTAQPYYVNTSYISAGLRIEGSTAYVRANVTAKKACDISVTAKLQRKENGSWKTICSFVEYSSNGVKDMTHSYTLSKRGTYRTYAIFNVGGEVLTISSSSKTY